MSADKPPVSRSRRPSIQVRRRDVVSLALARIKAREDTWFFCTTADVHVELRHLRRQPALWPSSLANRWPWDHAVTREQLHAIGRMFDRFDYRAGEWGL